MERLVKSDKELLIVFKVLLAELKERLKGGKYAIFLPWKFVMPEEEIEIKEKKKYYIKKTGEKIVNFSFEPEETEAGIEEAMRLLGVTLYHLVVGKSEYTHESYILDGYRRPLDSAFWPIIAILLKGEVRDLGEIEKMVEEVNLDEIKASIQPAAPAVVIPGKNRNASDIIRELTSERIKIIGHEHSAAMWGIVVPADIQIRYNEASLRDAIDANARGELWAIGYYSGQNPRQMRQKIGANTSSQLCFSYNDWWLKRQEDFWANKKYIIPGYYLLNFNGKGADQNWDSQERLITDLGSVYERCHEFVVTETVLTNFRANRGERLLGNWFHWGKEFDSDRDRVRVGGFDSDGFVVDSSTPSRSGGILRVVVARKFDF